MVLLFFIRLLLAMAASGLLIYNSRFFRNIPSVNRIVVGITSTPLFLALYDYILGLVWPGAPIFLFQYGVIIFSLFFLSYKKNYQILCTIFIEKIKIFNDKILSINKIKLVLALVGCTFSILGAVIAIIKQHLSKYERLFEFITFFFIGIIMICLIVYLFWVFQNNRQKKVLFDLVRVILVITGGIISVCLIFNAMAEAYISMPGVDESHYGMQARFFVEDRNSWEIDNYSGIKEGTILSDDHGPLWELVMADAEFFAEGKMNSGIVRMYISIIGILFYIAMFNYGHILHGNICGILSVFLILFYRYSLSFTFGGDREAFRFLALFLFVIFIFSYIKSMINKENRIDFANNNRKKRMGDCISWFWGVLIIFYLGMNGHGSNVILLFSVFIIYTVFALYKKLDIREYIITGVGALIGVLLCLIKNIRRFFVEGSFTSSTTWAFRGTIAAEMTAETAEATGNWNTIIESYTQEEFILIGFGILSLLGLLGYFFIHKMQENTENNTLVFFNVWLNTGISLGMLLPLTKVYDFLGYEFSKWLVGQLRYRIYFFVVFALLAASVIAIFCKSAKRYVKCFGWLSAIIVCIISIRVTGSRVEIPFLENNKESTVEYHIETSDNIVEKYHTDGNIFVSDQILGYFFKIPTKLGFTEYNHQILAATNELEVKAAIDELDMELFVFSYKDDYYHYEVLPFYHYLTSSADITREIYYRDDEKRCEIEIYKVPQEIWN